MADDNIKVLGLKEERIEGEAPLGDERPILPVSQDEGSPLADFPVHDLGPWPENLSLRREDLYRDQ
jgi:hypothetical protein